MNQPNILSSESASFSEEGRNTVVEKRSELEVIDFNDSGYKIKVERTFLQTRKPVVLKGVDIGSCVRKWSPEYLIENCDPEKKVKVHKSKEKSLNFLKKNFIYDTISFRELIYLCSGKKVVDIEEEKYQYYWYLRSLGEDPRGKDVSDIAIHFPTLHADLNIPDVFPKESFFSSVFRITSPELQLWTHYDTCDNILIQIKGTKRVVFYPPKEALNLYLNGDKSEIIDIDNPDLHQYPKFANTESFETILREGDIVFIPALWFHNITACEYSVSVNVFWKNLKPELYDKKDPYGNKDLIPAQLGYKTLEKIIDQLNILPHDYQDFYIRRMLSRLDKRLHDIQLDKKKAEEEIQD